MHDKRSHDASSANFPTVLLAHERMAVLRPVTRVLELQGFRVETAINGRAVARLLDRDPWDALVTDVALPGVAGYELCELAKRGGTAGNTGARVVVLVASVFRRTSYKRRPTRLYGADDYVEIHHLGDELPDKLRQHLGLASPASAHREASEAAFLALRAEGDRRMSTEPQRLASLIVADMVLYNGDAIAAARNLEEAEHAVREDLAIASQLFAQVQLAEGRGPDQSDRIGLAFRELMELLGRSRGE